jgi:predicted DNA-binding transcriptional regulator YafY
MRQWQVPMHVATEADCTIASLARDHEASERTIRRDLAAFEFAGFHVDSAWVDGHKCWRLAKQPMKAITETTFTLPEMCAFYLNQTQMACTGGKVIGRELQSAMGEVGKALGPQMKGYLDRLCGVLTWKPDAPKPAGSDSKQAAVDELVRATMDHKRIRMDYRSLASGKTKPYSAEPYRLTIWNGGLYLYAYVPDYGQMRTFAVHRIKKMVVTDEPFSPVQEASSKPYETSIGMYSGGTPELVKIEFGPKLAQYVEERVWHKTQQVERRSDGSLVLSMNVAVDVPLRSWILGFGHQARVLRPSALAEMILEELEEARVQYAPRTQFELPPQIYGDSRQPSLPFRSARRRRRHATLRSDRRSPDPRPPRPGDRTRASAVVA